jgi:hypothetical protein
MSGTYGIVRQADFNPSDAEIFLSYQEKRSSLSTGFTKEDVETYLSKQNIASGGTLDGVYKMKLPLSKFNKAGIYTIMIRPKQISGTIMDVGVLTAYPDVRGIVVGSSGLPSETDGLTGYRVEYFDQSNAKIANLHRIITSSNKCEFVNTNANSSTQKAGSYRFTENSENLFLTLSPSAASSVRPNSIPFIGNPGGKIVISNTFFNPVMMEIEMTDNDIETLYTSMNGNQIRNLETGIMTTYDKNNNIFDQKEYYVIKSTANGNPALNIKVNKTEIDFTQDFNTITSQI